MAKSHRKGMADTARSAQATSSPDHHGVKYTLWAPRRQLSLYSAVQAPRQRTLSEAWSELWETDPTAFPVRLSPFAPWPKVRRFAPAFLTSMLVHASTVFFLCSIPLAVVLPWITGRPAEEMSSQPPMVVYEIQHLSLPDYLPVINPPGPEEASEQGAKLGASSRFGRSHFDPRITIISNPPHPDNFRFTLRTENAPSDIKPPKEAKVPDLITRGPTATREAAKSSSLAPAKVANLTPGKPHVATPPKSMETKNLAPQEPAPREGTHPAAEASSAPPRNKSETSAASDTQRPATGPKIMALSVEPIPLKDLTAIPAGIREGAFSISPSGTVRGFPGRAPGAPPDVGKGGHGPEGEKSVAVGNGSGNRGGAGHAGSASTPSASPLLSVSGRAGATGISAGTLAPLKAEDLVYAVKPETPKARAPNVVVSSGSWGGGGLRV